MSEAKAIRWRWAMPLGWIAILLIGLQHFTATNFSKTKTDYGWDATVECAAAEAYQAGQNPYYATNLKNTDLSYPYAPVTLPIMNALCSSGILSHNLYRYYFVLLMAGIVGLLAGVRHPRSSAAWLAAGRIGVLAGFGLLGFEYTFRTGNIAMLDGLLVAAGIFFLKKGTDAQIAANKYERTYFSRAAALLGFAASIKIIFAPALLGLCFLPVTARRKLGLLALALCSCALPFAISYTMQPMLFGSWLASILGHIPHQHSPANEGFNPSLLFISQALLLPYVGNAVAHVKLGWLLYAITCAGIIVTGIETIYDALKEQKTRLSENPAFALYATCMIMLALSLCAPRLKGYSLLNLAIYIAVLSTFVSNRRALLLAFVMIIVPIIWHALPIKPLASFDSTNTFAALICYGILLLSTKSVLKQKSVIQKAMNE
jgi:hypothetical protein